MISKQELKKKVLVKQTARNSSTSFKSAFALALGAGTNGGGGGLGLATYKNARSNTSDGSNTMPVSHASIIETRRATVIIEPLLGNTGERASSRRARSSRSSEKFCTTAKYQAHKNAHSFRQNTMTICNYTVQVSTLSGQMSERKVNSTFFVRTRW